MNGIRRFGAIATAILTAIVATGTAAQAQPTGQIQGTSNPNAIADNYIVVFKQHTATSSTAVNALAAKYPVKVEHTYLHALRGFAGTMSRTTAQRLAAEPEVAYVEQNGTVTLADTQPSPPSWGLDRIDQRNLPLDSSYTYPSTAPNVRAYIIDTGIRTTHTTFGGRAIWGTNTTGDGNDTDCHGHGTHVAGTVGGAQYGVAKTIALTAVKVLDCSGSGSFAGVAAGVDWVTGNHPAGAPAVANMSLGGPGSNTTVEDAVRNSINSGVVYAIASGNSNSDACNFTPARVAEAITVNASTINDARASFSNFGSCTDIFAPGESITSSWNTSDTATAVLSGTSMATPHITGAAALILSANPGMSPDQVAASMFNSSTMNVIANPGPGSPNRLLFVDNNTLPPGVPVALRAQVNGRMVCAENAGQASLIANRDWIAQWETFDLIDTGDGYVAFRSHANARIVTAENAGQAPLIANRDWIGPWEKFQIIDNPDGSISLRALANGRIVTAENAGQEPLIANRDWIGPWEEFDLIRL